MASVSFLGVTRLFDGGVTAVRRGRLGGGAGGAGSATDGTAVGIGVSRIASARRSATHTGMAASIRMVSIVTRWSGRSCALVLTLPILRTTSMPLMT